MGMRVLSSPTHSLLHSSTEGSGKLCVSLHLSIFVFVLFCCSLVEVRFKKFALGKVMTFEATCRSAILPLSKMLCYDPAYPEASSFVWNVRFQYFLHPGWFISQWFGMNVILPYQHNYDCCTVRALCLRSGSCMTSQFTVYIALIYRFAIIMDDSVLHIDTVWGSLFSKLVNSDRSVNCGDCEFECHIWILPPESERAVV